jgi:UDP-2,3-diacylglucosamine hydrolase
LTAHSLFIADLHLCPERPAINTVFFRFIEKCAPRAEALYILGDLFEAWVGDDDLSTPLHSDIAHSLRSLSELGVAVFLMHGNRDFLMGEAFCDRSKIKLIADPTRIELYGTTTLLMHGDTLCTDDIDYQQFRLQVRDVGWQQRFLNLPLAARKMQAAALRETSEHQKQDKAPEIMDVNPDAVIEAFRGCDCPRIIHGHTHRPARHALAVDGVQRERWVLPAWYEGGGYLACAAKGCELFDLPG